MTILYHLTGVRHRYGDRLALEIPELAIRQGGLYLLTGANGSGKSTLLQILALLMPPTAGTVSFHGRPIDWRSAGLLEIRRRVTLLHQAPYLFNESVAGNVAFGLRARGIAGGRLRQLVDEALDMVGLRGFQKRRARELSGGEAQRVAMARALAIAPEVLLLDEPLANVDRQSAAFLEELIGGLPARGTSVVMTTHNPEQPIRLGGERIHLVAGRLAAVPEAPHSFVQENCQHADL